GFFHANGPGGSPAGTPGRRHPDRLGAGARRGGGGGRAQQAGAGKQPDPARGDGLPAQRGAHRQLPQHDHLLHADALLHVRRHHRAVQNPQGHCGRVADVPRRPAVHGVARRGGGRPRPARMRGHDGGVHPGKARTLERGHHGTL
ncbi:MAG: Cytosine deaminase, partial [uncultured Cytophagales bacterium]